jgi:hypothetical protein
MLATLILRWKATIGAISIRIDRLLLTNTAVVVRGLIINNGGRHFEYDLEGECVEANCFALSCL